MTTKKIKAYFLSIIIFHHLQLITEPAPYDPHEAFAPEPFEHNKTITDHPLSPRHKDEYHRQPDSIHYTNKKPTPTTKTNISINTYATKTDATKIPADFDKLPTQQQIADVTRAIESKLLVTDSNRQRQTTTQRILQTYNAIPDSTKIFIQTPDAQHPDQLSIESINMKQFDPSKSITENATRFQNKDVWSKLRNLRWKALDATTESIETAIRLYLMKDPKNKSNREILAKDMIKNPDQVATLIAQKQIDITKLPKDQQKAAQAQLNQVRSAIIDSIASNENLRNEKDKITHLLDQINSPEKAKNYFTLQKQLQETKQKVDELKPLITTQDPYAAAIKIAQENLSDIQHLAIANQLIQDTALFNKISNPETTKTIKNALLAAAKYPTTFREMRKYNLAPTILVNQSDEQITRVAQQIADNLNRGTLTPQDTPLINETVVNGFINVINKNPDVQKDQALQDKIKTALTLAVTQPKVFKTCQQLKIDPKVLYTSVSMQELENVAKKLAQDLQDQGDQADKQTRQDVINIILKNYPPVSLHEKTLLEFAITHPETYLNWKNLAQTQPQLYQQLWPKELNFLKQTDSSTTTAQKHQHHEA